MIWVNFKTFKAGSGQAAVKLAKVCQEVKVKTGVAIIPVVQTADLFRVSQKAALPIWSQHTDYVKYGPNTGFSLAETILAAGASGTLLNHSENKLPFEVVGATIKRVKSLGMKVLVCCQSIEEGKEVIKYEPNFLAYEPAEFIGNREVSVATARPKVIADFVSKFPNFTVIVGAGIHSRQDVVIARKLGAKGILVATDVVLALDPVKELSELAQGFKEKG